MGSTNLLATIGFFNVCRMCVRVVILIFMIKGVSHLVFLSNYMLCCLNMSIKAWQQCCGVWGEGITCYFNCL